MQKEFFLHVIQNTFFEILLPKTTTITVRNMYIPPSQTNFLETLAFEKIDIDKRDIYILDNLNINIYRNNRYIIRDDNTISSKFLSDGVSQKCAINVGMFHHQLIFSTRNIFIIKTSGVYKYLIFCSFKNYTSNYYKEALQQVDFPNYKNVSNVNEAYSKMF